MEFDLVQNESGAWDLTVINEELEEVKYQFTTYQAALDWLLPVMKAAKPQKPVDKAWVKFNKASEGTIQRNETAFKAGWNAAIDHQAR